MTGNVGVAECSGWGSLVGRVGRSQDGRGLLADQRHILKGLALYAEGRWGWVVGGGDAGWGCAQEVVMVVQLGGVCVGASLLRDSAWAVVRARRAQAVEAVETVHAPLLLQVFQRALEGTHHAQLAVNTTHCLGQHPHS